MTTITDLSAVHENTRAAALAASIRVITDILSHKQADYTSELRKQFENNQYEPSYPDLHEIQKEASTAIEALCLAQAFPLRETRFLGDGDKSDAEVIGAIMQPYAYNALRTGQPICVKSEFERIWSSWNGRAKNV